MEKLIVNSILKLERLEKDLGKMGTIIALVLISMVTVGAVFLISQVLFAWLEICEAILKHFTGYTFR